MDAVDACDGDDVDIDLASDVDRHCWFTLPNCCVTPRTGAVILVEAMQDVVAQNVAASTCGGFPDARGLGALTFSRQRPCTYTTRATASTRSDSHGTRHAVNTALQRLSAMRATTIDRQWHPSPLPLFLRSSSRRAADSILDAHATSPSALR